MKNLTHGDMTLIIICYLTVGICAVSAIIPFYLVVVNSFTENAALVRFGYKLIPAAFTTKAYEYLSKSGQIGNSYLVTIFVAFVGTSMSFIFTSTLSYVVSLKTLKYRNYITFFVYFTMLFSGGIVPWYILISRYLHLKDNLFVMILPFLVNPFYMFLLKNYFATLPFDIFESAKIDGSNEFRTMVKIALPLSLPAIVTICLFYFLDYWNQWYAALFFIDKENLYPLQYLIMKIIRNAQFAKQIGVKASGIALNPPTETIKLATAIVAIGPIVLVYPFVQKYFVKGLTLGAVKS